MSGSRITIRLNDYGQPVAKNLLGAHAKVLSNAPKEDTGVEQEPLETSGEAVFRSQEDDVQDRRLRLYTTLADAQSASAAAAEHKLQRAAWRSEARTGLLRRLGTPSGKHGVRETAGRLVGPLGPGTALRSFIISILLAVVIGVLLGSGFLLLFTHNRTASPAAVSPQNAQQKQDISAISAYLVQVGAYKDQGTAQSGLDSIQSKGIKAAIVGDSPYLIVVGAVTDTNQSQALLQQLEQKSIHYYLKPLTFAPPPSSSANDTDLREINRAVAQDIILAAAIVAKDAQLQGGLSTADTDAAKTADVLFAQALDRISTGQNKDAVLALRQWNRLLQDAVSAKTPDDAEISLARFLGDYNKIQTLLSTLK